MLGWTPRLACLGLGLLLLDPTTARGQSLQETLNELFVFSGGENPLFLGGSAGLPNTQVHGDHFIPSESETNATLLDFFNNAIASNIASFPLSSTVSSETFVFVGGVPKATSNSFGPIFAERAQTIGRGRLNAALNYSRLRFSEIRGADLDDIRLSFVHDNVDFPNCDEIFEGDCAVWGVPQFENDVIDLTLDLDIEADVYALSATFGLTDWLDLGLAVPVIDLELRGTSLATITTTTGDEALHFFGGTPESPVLEARNQAGERATGIGDVAGRLKARLVQGDKWRFSVLGEVRAPTGREEDFLGTGEFSGRSLLILSGTFSGFSPHGNRPGRRGIWCRRGLRRSRSRQDLAGLPARARPYAVGLSAPVQEAHVKSRQHEKHEKGDHPREDPAALGDLRRPPAPRHLAEAAGAARDCVEPPLLGHSLQGVTAAVFEAEARPRLQVAHRARDQHFPGSGFRGDPRADVYRDPTDRLLLPLDLPHVHAAADLEPQPAHRVADGAGAEDRPCRALERGQEAVAGGAHLPATVAAQLLTHQRMVLA
jgi:hypothetical protein